MVTKVEKCPTCNADAIDRSEFWEAAPDNGNELEQQIYKIKRAIKKYYLALDNHKHGGVACSKALKEIESVLVMSWQRGEVKEWLEKTPLMRVFYEDDEQ